MASATEEQALIDGYNLRSEEFPKGRDFYAMMASAAFKRDYWDCTEFRQDGSFNEEGKAYRSRAKGLQLGIAYGMGAARIAKAIDADFEEAQQILHDFFSTYQNVKIWKEFNMEKMKTYGFMETALGRRRRLPDSQLKSVVVKVYKTEKVEDNPFPFIISSIKVLDEEQSERETAIFDKITNFKKKEALKETMSSIPGYDVIDNGGFIARAGTQCTNSVIQGSAADMTKLAMIEIFDSPILQKYHAKLRFLVHDEILIECPVIYKDIVKDELIRCMLDAPKKICSVSMAVDPEVQTRWRLEHFCGTIKKFAKDKSLQEVFDEYSMYNQEDLEKIVKGEFNWELEELRVR